MDIAGQRWITAVALQKKIILVRNKVRSDSYNSANKIKQILRLHLISQGWNVVVTRRLNFSFDIEAVRGNERWIIEVNSIDDSGMVESFVSVLGKLLQRMDTDDPQTKYSVAFPDNKPFRRLWERLPLLVKRKAGITALFVEETGKITEMKIIGNNIINKPFV